MKQAHSLSLSHKLTHLNMRKHEPLVWQALTWAVGASQELFGASFALSRPRHFSSVFGELPPTRPPQRKRRRKMKKGRSSQQTVARSLAETLPVDAGAVILHRGTKASALTPDCLTKFAQSLARARFPPSDPSHCQADCERENWQQHHPQRHGAHAQCQSMKLETMMLQLLLSGLANVRTLQQLEHYYHYLH